MLLLTIRDLQFRAVRIALVTVGTSLVFALLLLMTGLVARFHAEPIDTANAMGADGWVLPVGVSGPFTSASTVDPSLAGQVVGAQRADPFITSRSTLWRGNVSREVVLLGYTSGGLGTPPVVEGVAASKAGQVVVDETTKEHVGSRVRVGSSYYTVTGLTRDTTLLAGVPLVFMTLPDAQALAFRGKEVVSGVLVKGHPTAIPNGFELLSNQTVADDALKPLEQALGSVNLVRVLLWIVSAMIIGGVVYLSSMERRRDFAVLKAIGASSRGLLAGLALQAALVAIVAATVASGLQLLLAPRFPLKVAVSMGARIQLPVIALVVALAASAAGMRRVARTDPASAFSGPGG